MVRPTTPFTPPAPEGWEAIRHRVEELNQEMEQAVDLPLEDVPPNEVGWPISKADWRRSRYIFRLYKRKEISEKLYTWLVFMDYANGELCELWSKPGYEFACCAHCAMVKSERGTVCACRHPNAGEDFKCSYCGCTGCT